MQNSLPIYQVIDDLKAALNSHSRAILQAEPGAGKSTVVPLELMDEPWLNGRKILLLEPRRLAARMVATRLAGTLGEEPGERVGYRMRGEVKVSSRTRIEVITEGLLSRMLQNDPTLEEVGLVIFDEVHERSLQSDLGLALTLQAQELFREDLRILLMSATLDSQELLPILGAETPVIRSRGRSHPVTLRYQPPHTPRPPLRELPHACARTVREALQKEEGSILVFLPGAGEIRRCQELLGEDLPSDVILAPLYGALSPALQRRAVAPAPPDRRKVVLATNLAETSLTIEGIRIVIDGGYERQVRYDARRGIDRMETLPVSAESAAQRTGRAGRTAPGVCYRLWSEERPLAPRQEPEILRSDLAPLVLELAAWGSEASELAWIDPPPDYALREANDLLKKLEMIDEEGRITPLGEKALELGEHPRIAHMLLVGLQMDLGYEAALMATILTERPPLHERDLSLVVEEIHGLLSRTPDALPRRFGESLQRLLRRLKIPTSPRPRSDKCGMLLALAYPERIALRREERGSYLSAGGRGMRLRGDDPLGRHRLLAVAEVSGSESEAVIHLAAPLTREELEEIGALKREEVLSYSRENDRIEARRVLRCGTLILESAPLPRPSAEAAASILLEEIRRRGWEILPHTPRSESLRFRAGLLHRRRGDPWPDLSPDRLMKRLEEWLLPWMEGVQSLAELAKIDLETLYKGVIGWERMEELERLLPREMILPSGSRAALDYSDPEEPVVRAKLQECFGWMESPRILEGELPVTLELLSPARRLLARTRDLENFWQQVYPEVRKEMRGRYPKHPWPEDPFSAMATAKTKRQLARES